MAKKTTASLGFKISPIVKTETLTFVNKRKRGSQFDVVIEAVRGLTKIGQSIEVENTDDSKTFNNRINGVMKSANIVPPDGTALVKRATTKGYAFSLVDAKDAPTKKSKRTAK